jgi:hypothetical protein
MSDNKLPVSSNWYLRLEANRRFVIGSVVVVCTAILLVMSLRNPVDYDGYWHLQMGKDWVENGLSPYRDHYSFTHQNETITSPPVLFQAGLHLLVKTFGEWGGFISLKLLGFILLFASMLAWLKQIKAPALIYCLVLPMLVYLIQVRAQVRPELFSYSFSIMALMLYQRTQLRLSISAIAPIALFILLWSNYHSSIIGYIIFFGLFIDIGAKLIKEKQGLNPWLTWAGWGVLLVTVGALNPSLTHPVYGALTFSDIWKHYILEYHSPLVVHRGNPSIYLLACLAGLTLVLAALQRKFGYLTCGAVLLYAAMSMSRMVTPSGIVFLCMFAHVISDSTLQNRLKAKQNKQLRLILIASLAGFVIPMLGSVASVRAAMLDNHNLTDRFPSALVTYMLDNNKAGRIFNSYRMGGYLINRLSPESQVFIDGRTGILYPIGHLLKYENAMIRHENMATEIKKYDIDFAILPASSYFAWNILQTGEMGLDYVDVKYSLFSRQSPGFPNTGKLWARPYCWSDLQSADLVREWGAAQSMLPPRAPVMPLLATAIDYSSREDQGAWLSSLRVEQLWDKGSKRFLAYRALEHNLNDLTITLFGSITDREIKDDLAIALALVRKNDYQSAEKVLDLVFLHPPLMIEMRDLVIMDALLAKIQSQQPLGYIDQGFVEKLSTRAGQSSLSKNDPLSKIQPFCAS